MQDNTRARNSSNNKPQYHIVGCRECRELWILKDKQSQTYAVCRKCETRFETRRLRSFRTAHTLDEARELRGEILAEKAGHLEEFKAHRQESTNTRTQKNDGDLMEYAAHCRCGAKYRSRRAFKDHVDDIVNGTGVCENAPAEAADGGVTTAATPTSQATPSITAETTNAQMWQVVRANRDEFRELLDFCQKEHNGERPRRRTLKAIMAIGDPTYDDLVERVGVARVTIRKYIKELREADVVVTTWHPTCIRLASDEAEIVATEALDWSKESDDEGGK